MMKCLLVSVFMFLAVEARIILSAAIDKAADGDRLDKLQKDVKHLLKMVHHIEDNINNIHIHVHGRNIGAGAGARAGMTKSRTHFTHFHAFRHQDVEAHCDVTPNKKLEGVPQIHGHVHITQNTLSELHVAVKLSGFPTDKPGQYAIHVHELNDTSDSCNSLGSHFNPHNHEHGHKDDPHGSRHAGDWGNIVANSNGIVNQVLHEKEATMVGENSIIGRSIVVHEKADNHGNSGARLACCVITGTKHHLTPDQHHHHEDKHDDDHDDDHEDDHDDHEDEHDDHEDHDDDHHDDDHH